MHYWHTMHGAKDASIRRLLIALLLFAACTATVFAEVKITNVEAKTEKRPNSTTGKDEVWVVATYNITDVPSEGAVLKLEATLANAKGDAFSFNPIEEEMSGAIGTITSDGAKVIEWQAEKSLVRMSRQGKYRCFITLSIEGTSAATRAVLNVRKYENASWYYFSTGMAEITNLQRAPAFTTACNPVQGSNWHQNVEQGAVFYTGTVTSIPAYRGRRANDVITGTPGQSGCSAFLAIKDQGTPNEKIWVNFAKQMNMQLDNDRNGVPEQHFIWEFQFRYYASKKDNTKALSTGNAGKPDQTDSWTEWHRGEDFDLELSAAPAAKEKSNTFDLEVVRREFKYFYKGKHEMTFTALGDGYFEGGNDVLPNTLTLKEGDMKINDYITLSGTFSIDTTVDHASINSVGAWSTPEGSTLWIGPFNAKLTTDFEGTVGAPIPTMHPKWNIGGFVVSFEKIRFVGGSEKATGVQFDLRLLIKQLSSGCAFDIKKDPLLAPGSSVAGFKLNGVTLTADKWSISGVEAQNVGMTIAPTFCLKSLKANYDEAAKKLTAELIVKGPIFDDLGGGFTLVDGSVDAYRIIMKTAGGGVPIPYPPPPAHVAEWRGFDVTVSNVLNGPFTMKGKLFFANNSAWKTFPAYGLMLEVLGKVPGIKIDDVKLFEVDGIGEYVHLQKFTGGFVKRMFALVKDTWILESSCSLTIEMNPSVFSLQSDGGYKVFNFGNDQWFFNGSGNAGVTILPQFKFGGSMKGEVLVPALFKNNPVFVAINDWFKLPWKLGNIGVAMNNLSVSFNADIPRLGNTTVLLDLSKDPITQPTQFMWISNGGSLLSTKLKEKNDNRSMLSAADTTWTEFTVTAEMERAFVQIWGNPAPTPSVLADPQGRIHTATAQDSSVIFYPSEEPGQSDMWAIRNPAAGLWKTGLTGSHAGDSIHIWAKYRSNTGFNFNSEAQGRTIIARWSGATNSPNAQVDLFLDKDQQGMDGVFIGTVAASAGEFRYTMTDSLPECGYYIYAMRNDSGALSTAYSPLLHDNAKTALAPPTNIQAEATAAGDATITWNASSDPKVMAYAVRVTDADGKDSVYTTRNFNFTMAQIHIENWQGKRISIQSAGDDNLTGCWSEPVSLSLAGVEEYVAGGGRSQDVEMHVAPLPVRNHSTIMVNVLKNEPFDIDLYDIEGRRVMPLRHDVVEPGTVRVDLDASSLPNGIYIVRVTGAGIFGSKKIIVSN